MKSWIVFILAALVISILHIQLLFSSWGLKAEPLALDLWFNLRGTAAAPQDVVVVAMDESSYRNLNVPLDQAWPRRLHAQLLRRLKEYGAKRIVMDILFLDESADKQADLELAEAMALTPTVIGADSGTVTSTAGRFVMEEILQPNEVFTEKAETIALARLADDFGTLRRFFVPRSSATQDIPSLYEAGAGLRRSNSTQALPGENDFIWYYGPSGTVPTYPFHQVLNVKGALPQATFKDKTVFVGLSLRTELGPSQKDTYRTPFYERGSMFGVEIQATAAANLLNKQWIRRASAWTEGSVLFILTFLFAVSIFSLRPQWAGLLVLCSATIWALVSYYSFLSGFFVPGTLLVCVILPFTYLASTLAYYLLTHKSQQKVERAFQMYLSPEMARLMRSNPDSLSLGGESVFATAVFTDIEGFTSITEEMSAAEVSRMLNAYFTEVMNIVIEKQGTLIKFIGDAVFALWGAPIKDPNHARLACETALGIQHEVEKFNASKRFPALNTRVGVNTGSMVVGNLGSARRFDYTAIGDSVNLASRLEGLNKYFGTNILVSESSRKEAGGQLKFISLGYIVAAGKKEAVEVHTLFTDGVKLDVERDWDKALTKFRLRNWEEAEQLLDQVAQVEPRLRKAALLYRQQIADFKVHTPDEEWRGELSFEKK